MSQDIQLAWPCPHLTIEHVSLGSDRRTIQTSQPIASSGTVRVRLDGQLVPSSGLSIHARLFSSHSGPFTLTPSDEVSITTSGGSFSAPLGVGEKVRWTASQVVSRLLQLGLKESVAKVSAVNGHLLFEDLTQTGSESYVKGSAPWFDRQTRASGRRLTPPWSLQVTQGTLSDRRPRFHSPIKGSPIIEVTYSAPANRCLRCRAAHVENDYRFAVDGHSILVDDEDLLQQQVLKAILTDKGSNPYHTWYGTGIRRLIGSKVVGRVSASLKDEIRQSLDKLQKLQRSQSEVQVVSPKERLFQILGVQVFPHEQDPTTFYAEVTVQNASGEPVQLNTVFTVPDVVARMGSNGLMLGAR